MKKLLLITLLLLGTFIFLIFHDRGNQFIKPYLSSYLTDYLPPKLKKNMEIKTIEIAYLKIDIDGIASTLILDEKTKIQLKGKFSLFAQKEKIIHDVQMEIKKGELEELLRITKQKPYGKGEVDLRLNMPILTENIQSTYLLKIADLSKLKPINNRRLQGAMEIEGSIVKDNKITTIKGVTKNLEGEIAFTLVDKKLYTVISDISVQKLMDTLNYPQFFKAKMVGQLNYDLSKQKGIFTSKLNQAQLLPNQLTTLIKKIQGTDLTKERYNQTSLNATIEKALIAFDFQAKSKTTTLKINPATLNQKNHSINANYTLNVEEKDIGGTIKGDINNPKITIDSSKYMQKEIIDKVKEYIHIDDKTLKDLGIGEEEKEVVKELFRGFFK